MPFLLALPFSLALVLVASWLTTLTEAPIAAFMVIGTSLWLYFDSRRVGLARYRTWLLNPEVATIASFLMWIVVFPWYLHTRYRIANGTQPLRENPPQE